MQETSKLYDSLYLDPEHWVETQVTIGESALLITEYGETITFGGERIKLGAGDEENGYGENMLLSVSTNRGVFADDKPGIGGCVSGEISLQMLKPVGKIEKMAKITPYIRLVSGEQHSEWIQKGTFYIDTRENTAYDDGTDTMTIHGYDAMLKAEKLFPDTLVFPAVDLAVVNEVARLIGVEVDPRTVAALDSGFTIQKPVGYTIRETLGFIGIMYVGNWIINDKGMLQLIFLNDLAAETELLVNEVGYPIVFGQGEYATRIIV